MDLMGILEFDYSKAQKYTESFCIWSVAVAVDDVFVLFLFLRFFFLVEFLTNFTVFMR